MTDLQAYLDRNKARFTEDLRRLVEIDSVRTEAKPGMPFGEGGAKALAEAAAILAEHGYAVKNYDNFALEADLGPAPELMLLAHLDVVPVGDGWTKEPFALTVEGDTVYGRGSTDDKGPAAACILAMDACRALWGEPKTGVRLVLGSGEETGSEDMRHYFSLRPTLPYTLSPDAEYPLINIEKGHFSPYFTKTAENGGEKRLISFTGGNTQNIVPGKARAQVAGFTAAELSPYADRAAEATGASFTVEDTPNGCAVLCAGVSAHASTPEKGVNAQTALLTLLCSLPLDENETAKTLAALLKLFPHRETDGRGVGVKTADAVSGALTLNFGVLHYENGTFRCGADMRCPVCADGSGIEETFLAAVSPYGFSYVGEPKLTPSHCVPEESRLVQTCLQGYEAHTGEPGKCVAIGGGTYVHDIEGGIAFGVEFPGRDYRIHGADEYADLNEMLQTAAMYADVIRELCYE